MISDIYYNDILRPVFELKSNVQLESVRTANRNSVPVTGSVSFPVIIDQLEYQCDASVVSGLAYNIILGRDFLHKFSAITDARGQTVQFSGTNVVYFATGNAPPHKSEVKVALSVIIDAHSESIIPAYLETSPFGPFIGLIEAVPKLSDRYQLSAASVVSRSEGDGRVPFHLLNPTDQLVLLHKRTTTGQFVEQGAETIILPLDSEPVISSVEPPKLSQALSDSENKCLADLLGTYADLFATSSLDLGHTSIVQHNIDTGNAKPIKQSPYRVSQAQRAEIETHISNVLEQGIIEVSKSVTIAKFI